MDRLRILVCMVAALVISGCALPTTIITETDTEVRVMYGGGGLLKKKRIIYEPFYEICKTKQCMVDGAVISADAFYAFGLPGVCYTKQAVWSPHAVSAGGMWRLAAETDAIMLYLPEPMRAHFRASFWYWDFITARDIPYRELLTIWPEGACERE